MLSAAVTAHHQSVSENKARVGQRLTAALAGAAGGMAVNSLSSDFGYRGATIAIVLAGIFSGIVSLRQLPPGAPLVRMASGLVVVLSIACMFVAVLGPRAWATPALLATAALIVIAVLVQVNAWTGVRLLSGVAAIGLGTVFLGKGIEEFDERWVRALLAIGIGLGVSIYGIGRLIDRQRIAIGGLLLGCLTLSGLGVSVLIDGRTMMGWAGIVAGIAGSAYVIAIERPSKIIYAVAGSSFGLAIVAAAVAPLGSKVDWSGVALGAAIVLVAFAGVVNHPIFLGIAGLALGAALIAVGITILREGEPFLGVMFMAAGVGGAAVAPVLFGWNPFPRLIAYLTRDPKEP